MAGIFGFRCSSCGEIHEGSPSFAFEAPAPYLEQDEATRGRGQLGSDLCRYTDVDGEHFFIRVCLEIPILGVAEPFLWGLWVSLSERNFERYVATFDAPDSADCYFGWLCNYLPYYPDTYALKTRVHPRADGLRPWIELEDCGHPLAVDFQRGISPARAQTITEAIMHR